MAEDEILLERILDGAEDPTDLPLALLQRITNNFSEERKIGQGGFGKVYKGVIGERIVAVKRIHINENTFDDRLFRREFVSLRNTNHRNVVRFLGFCSSTYQKAIEDARSGEAIFANVLERLLCFEYISNGSLDKHVTDELRGLEWEARYEIITGICKGLRYLHEEKEIIHLDLKPQNILLDHHDGKYMVAKITDFGLSRPNKNSHTVGLCFGTLGYLAPEYRENSKTTHACDIYSLGVIITELVTGCKDVPNKDNVLRRWRHRWNKPPTQLQYQQVTRCIYIAERCREQKPEARPSISKLISLLSESESTYGQISPLLDEDDMLGIKPLELRVTSELSKDISCSIELTNGTTNCIAFDIRLPSAQYRAQPVKGILQPKFMCAVTITVQAQDVGGHDHADRFIVRSMRASLGLREEEITKLMSSAEGCKHVDEVDLMVVYESKKAQENCKRGMVTNMPAEEVPEAKKRKIADSAYGKGKNKLGITENAEATSMDINSSSQQQCIGQIEWCNLLPLQSFSRHYPTNKTYLGDESDRAVDSARGAMGSLLDKLGKLVTGDYRLDPSIKYDIESFSEDLANIHLDLPKLQNVARAKVFVDEVRELSYNIEDMVDSFLVHVEPDSGRTGFREIMHESVKLVQNGLTTHHQIGDVIRDIKASVKAVAKRKEKYNIDVKAVVANATTKATTDPRISAMYELEERLVGIKTPRDELIRLLQDEGNASKQDLKTISIVGMGGLGKTTLAKVVYEEVGGYHPKAFVSVGQNPDVETVLKKIIRKCQENFNTKNLDVGDLIEKLRELLEDKRYFIVIDDVWDSTTWDLISSAFPRNKCHSIVITTTRIHGIALACCNNASKYVYRIKPLGEEESKILFLGRTFGPENDCPITPRKEEISKNILKTCGGMPLAVNSIARLLAGEAESTWESVWKSLGALTEGKAERKSDIDNMKQILNLSYMYLPDDLKTCLLYVCKHPEDCEIDKNDLLEQWVTEGFVSRKGVLDAEDIAENNFKALINMCMIQPGKRDYNNEVLSCRVHDIILDLMRSKSIEVNFIEVIDGSKDVTGTRGEIRRVSVQYNDKEDSSILASIKGSLEHVRSVSLHRSSLVPYFLDFKYVRVLHFEDNRYSEDPIDLTGISRLFLLKYLKVALSILYPFELKLPDNIGQLQQLETIDLRGGKLNNYPSDIVTLSRLSYLRYFGYFGATIALPDRIDMLKSLHTLYGVCVYKSTIYSIKNLGQLTNLRNFGIRLFAYTGSEEKDQEINLRMNALHSSISRISTSLKSLRLDNPSSYNVEKCYSDWSKTLFPQGSHIRELSLIDCFERCPEWIGQLHDLYSFKAVVKEVGDGVCIAAGLPSLSKFELVCLEEKEESVVISGSGAFRALKVLIFDCLEASLTFEEGALPKVEKLDITSRPHMPHKFLPVGIEHLPVTTLKEICLRVSSSPEEGNWKVKGSEQWSERDWDTYFNSGHHEDKLREHVRKLSTRLKRACKLYHPSADIHIFYGNEKYSDDYEVDYEEDGHEEYDDDAYDDEDFCMEDLCSSEGNGSQTSAQVGANTRQLVQLIEEQKDSGRMGTETDAAPLVDTSLHLAVGSEGAQSGSSQGLAVLESLQRPFPSLLAPSTSFLQLALAPCPSPGTAEPVANFPVDINNDLFVQQGNNGRLVNAVGLYFELIQAPRAGLIDLNQTPPDGLLELNLAPPGELLEMAPPTRLLELNQAPPAGFLDLTLASPTGLLELNQAPPAGFLDLNQAPLRGLLDLNQAPPDEATHANSSN